MARSATEDGPPSAEGDSGAASEDGSARPGASSGAALANDLDANAIRSREKSDRWHEHHNVPLKTDCPARPFVHQLLRHATHAINEAEEQSVKAVLAGKGVTDFDSHFLFNRDYWNKRVRMPPRKADEASDNLLAVLAYLKGSDVFREYITEDCEKHILGWARRCREGRYEDLPDVSMYDFDRYDRDGLALWISRRGSKAENFHQKMNNAAPAFAIGAKHGHFLQVLVAFQYSVNAGVKRSNEPDFGHFMLNLEDRIQSRILEIYDVDLFPNRINVSEQNPMDLICVGVGPLSHDPQFVRNGDPADCLSGDLLFLARQMGLVYPLLPPATKREFGMIKSFCKHNPQPKMSDIQRLCRTFKSESNGVNVFPKLPSQIKPAIKQWKANEEITALKLQAGESYTELLQHLKGQTVSLEPPPENPGESAGQQSAVSKLQETSLRRLPPPHVPPLCAPTQNQAVPTESVAQTCRCAFYPICKADPRVCGGFQRDRCKMYGIGGKKKTPTEDELAKAKREDQWKEDTKQQNCAWHPYCTAKAVECGGRRKDECSKYGIDGSDAAHAPSDEDLARAKKVERSKRRKELRQAKKSAGKA